MGSLTKDITDTVEAFLEHGRYNGIDPSSLADSCDRYISERARSSLSEAQELARSYARHAEKRDKPLRLSAARVLARISHMNSRHAEAEKAYMTARRLTDDAMIRARIDRALIDVYMYFGDFTKSGRRARMALDTFTDAGSEADVAMTKVNYANVLHRRDRHREAEKYYHDAALFFEKSDNEPAVARCYYNRANTLVQLFEMDEAEHLYTESHRLYEKHGFQVDAVDARYGLAWLKMLQGKFHVALRELAACEEAYREAGQHRGAALCELDRAEVYLGLNLMEDARASARDAEKRFKDLKLRYESSKAAFFRAKAAFSLGERREARAALNRALKGFAADKNDGFSGAAKLLESRMAKTKADATAKLKAARRKFESAQLPLWRAYADLYSATINPDDKEALKRLASNKAAQAVPHVFAQWQTLLGDIAAEQGREVNARGHWRQAANRLDAVRAQLPPIELRTSFGRNLESPHRRLIDAEAAANPRKAAAWVERHKTAGVWAPLSDKPARDKDRRRVEESLKALAEQVAAVTSHITAHGERGFLAATGPGLGKLQRQVRRELLRVENDYEGSTDHINSIGRRTGELSRRYPVIQFHLTGADLLAFVHENGHVRLHRWRDGRAQMETFVRRLRFYLEKQLLSVFRDTPETFASEDRLFTNLGDWLWSPLEIAADHKTVLVVPDGELANLPWAALNSAGEPLLDRHQFVLTPSIRHHLRARDVRTRSKKMEVFVGQSDDLPEVRRELASIANAGGMPMTVHEPCNRETWPRDGSADIWHFAGHATFRADNPFYSYLAMADGPMFATDFRLRDVRVKLVTLAACRSGEQVAMPGEESTGLVRSLLEMGARNIIAGHWPVADTSTAYWMTTFYDSYLRGGSLFDAMRSASHAVRERYRSAYHWAAFSLFGAGS